MITPSPTTQPVPPSQLLSRLRWRYSCRSYDTTRSIPDDIWSVLEEVLVVTPSSYGLQPWKFFVVTDKELRKQLYPLAHNQQPVLDASHLVIFTVVDKMLPSDVERWCLRCKELHGEKMTDADFESMRKALTDELIYGIRSNSLYEWAAEQVHIALGSFMASCALLGIDTSPMGGIKAKEIDAFLGLQEQRLRTVVLCAAGYRSPDQNGSNGIKNRFSRNDVVQHLPEPSHS